MANLLRMTTAGIMCPSVVYQRKHVLVMKFLGSEGDAAPKLKHAKLTAEQARRCYQRTVEQMALMYTECRLIHCDLSEYNILQWKGAPYFIDVGQSVEVRS